MDQSMAAVAARRLFIMAKDDGCVSGRLLKRGPKYLFEAVSKGERHLYVNISGENGVLIQNWIMEAAALDLPTEGDLMAEARLDIAGLTPIGVFCKKYPGEDLLIEFTF